MWWGLLEKVKGGRVEVKDNTLIITVECKSKEDAEQLKRVLEALVKSRVSANGRHK